MVLMIILLILCLPLILMLSIFTTTSFVSIVIDVPVRGIDVLIEEVVELDLDKGETFDVDYIINPREATNKDVRFIYEQVGESKLAEFDEEGNKLVPTSYGTALVIVETLDGAFRDAFTVVVHSKRVESIVSLPLSDTVTVGQSTTVETEYFPEIVNDKSLTYRVKEGEGIVTVTGSGKITAIGIGTAVIEVTSLDNPEAKSEFCVNAVSSGVIDFVNDKSYLTAIDPSEGTLKAVVNPEIEIDSYSISLLDEDGNPLSDSTVNVTFDPSTGTVKYDFLDRTYIGTVEIQLTVTPTLGESVTKSCYVEQISEISIGWIDSIDMLNPGQYKVDHLETLGTGVGIDLKPLGANVSFRVTLSRHKNNHTATGVSGNVEFDVEFELEEGIVYTCTGGYVSIELEKASDGVRLIVRGVYEPTMDEIRNDSAVTYIKMLVTDENTGKVTEFEEISVVVY